MTIEQKSEIIAKHIENNFNLFDYYGQNFVTSIILNSLIEIDNIEIEEGKEISNEYNKILEREDKEIDDAIEILKHMHQKFY